MVQVRIVERNRGEDHRCGTTTGWNRHKAAGERPCDACAAAKSEYDHNWRLADGQTRRNRMHAKAQQQALKELKNAHLDEYRDLYLAAKKALIAEQIREANS